MTPKSYYYNGRGGQEEFFFDLITLPVHSQHYHIIPTLLLYYCLWCSSKYLDVGPIEVLKLDEGLYPQLDYILTVAKQLSNYSALQILQYQPMLRVHVCGTPGKCFFLKHVTKKYFYYTMKIFLISRIFQIKNSITTKKYMKLNSSYNRYKIHDHSYFSSGWQIILLEVGVLILWICLMKLLSTSTEIAFLIKTS